MQPQFEIPHQFNAADYFVDRNIREGRADKVAVICEDRSYTYSDIQRAVNQFGNALLTLGVRMEQRVALLLFDTEAFPQAFFGAIKIGAVPVCLNTLLRPKDYAYLLNDCRASVLVVDADLLPVIDEIRDQLQFLQTVIVANGAATGDDRELAALASAESTELAVAPTCCDDVCFWLYSSGTTGTPKGAVHLQHDMVVSARAYGIGVLQITENDTCFSAPKLFFAYGLGNNLYFPFAVGATAVLLPGRPTPRAVYDTVKQHRPTVFYGVPTLYAQLLEEPDGTMQGVRICSSAGEALPADVWQRWKERFDVEIIDGIGSTEMTQCFISNRIGEVRVGSTGVLVPGYEARIVDEDMRDLPNGEPGTLLIKGDSAAAYYWNKHEKTKQTMLGDWVNTGDKFYQDDEGFFYFAGRTDDMLKVGGIWVSPVEVEACLIAHPEVVECAVVAAADAEGMVKPKAFVVLRQGLQPTAVIEKELKDFVKQRLAHYKYPRWIEFVAELPKTATGKIKRFELRDLPAAAVA